MAVTLLEFACPQMCSRSCTCCAQVCIGPVAEEGDPVATPVSPRGTGVLDKGDEGGLLPPPSALANSIDRLAAGG
jgi:hypothetical protein